MKAYKKVLVVFVLLLTVFSNLPAAVTTEERAALVALYDSTGGNNWTNNDNWKVGEDPCCGGWYGVTCSTEGVTILYLPDNNLTGTIPSEIGNLTNLIHFSLSTNQLTGAIPVEIVNLRSLIRLHLFDNQLIGSIPQKIGNLTSLTSLYLHNNYLSGEIPSSIQQTDLAYTSGLNIHENCNLYSNDETVQIYIESKMYFTYEEFLETQGHCITLAPVIMYLLD